MDAACVKEEYEEEIKCSAQKILQGWNLRPVPEGLQLQDCAGSHHGTLGKRGKKEEKKKQNVLARKG